MNLDSLKVSGVNKISVTDSLNAPLLSFKVSLNDSTVIPSDNTLKITVRQNSNTKNYVFDLPNKLTTSDTFKVEPVFENNKVTMKTSIERSNQKSTLTSQRIDLFSGTNEIQTNYSNADIEVVYPKNIDLVKYFFMNTFVDSLDENNSLTLDDLYFKDAFTKEDEKLNLEVNKLSIDCLSSNNNNFLLDSLGNLSVNSITTKVKEETPLKTALNDLTINSLSSKNNSFSIDANGNLSVNSITSKVAQTQVTDFNKIYPVGSIYMSVNNTNPSTFFGGTWNAIAQGRTLVGVDTTQTEFNTVKKTGGEKTHKLTVNEMPSHNHEFNKEHKNGNVIAMTDEVVKDGFNFKMQNWQDAMCRRVSSIYGIDNKGGDQAHNNLQPYFTCYIWQRIS